MNTCRAVLAALAFATGPAAMAQGQETFSEEYWGTIIETWGPQADAIPVGVRVLVSYTVRPDAVDAEPGLDDVGIYPEGLVHMSVGWDSYEFYLTGGGGQVVVWNSLPGSGDYVDLQTDDIDIDTGLGGLQVGNVVLGFLGDTAMLDDIAVPAFKLDAQEYTVNLETSLGWSGFRYQLEPQPIQTSAGAFEFPPTPAGRPSPWQTVTLTNTGPDPLAVYGGGWAGPFRFEGCFAALVLDPGWACDLSGRFEPAPDQPLGLAEGLVGVRLDSGSIRLPARAFSYSRKALPGVANLRASIDPLGFVAPANRRMDEWLAKVERALSDGRPQNDRKACPHLRKFARRVEDEAARDRVSEWSAVAMLAQAQAVWKRLPCRGRL